MSGILSLNKPRSPPSRADLDVFSVEMAGSAAVGLEERLFVVRLNSKWRNA
jgi:hypothetical protein